MLVVQNVSASKSQKYKIMSTKIYFKHQKLFIMQNVWFQNNMQHYISDAFMCTSL